MTESDVIQLIAQLVTVLVAVGGVAWRVGASLRAIGSRLDVMTVHLEHSGEKQAVLSHQIDATEARARDGLEGAKRARREIWREVNWLRDRLTRVEALDGAPPPLPPSMVPAREE